MEISKYNMVSNLEFNVFISLPKQLKYPVTQQINGITDTADECIIPNDGRCFFNRPQLVQKKVFSISFTDKIVITFCKTHLIYVYD